MALALARCRIELNQASTELEAAQADLALKTREIVQLTRICRRHEAEVAALRSSTSWRLTWPLRRMVRLLRPARAGGVDRLPERAFRAEDGPPQPASEASGQEREG